MVSADIGRWLALDRALRLARRHKPLVRHRRAWKKARAAARDRVLGALRPDGTLPQTYGADRIDASALLLVMFGLLPAHDPRAARLVDATVRALGSGPLLYRYPPDGADGFSPGEAPFVPASWWTVTALAVLGRPEALRARRPALHDAAHASNPRSSTRPGERPAATSRSCGRTPSAPAPSSSSTASAASGSA